MMNKIIQEVMGMFGRVYVEITNICNMNCSFCHGHRRALRRMSAEEFGHILTALTGKTGYVYYHLMGEPLTHPQLPLFLQMAKGRGFKSVITTNGTLLSKHGQALIDAGVHKVSISVHSFEDGDDAKHESYVNQIAEFAGKAAAAGVIVCLRLWNKGFDNGLNDRTEELLRKALPGQWVVNSRGYRVRDRLFLEWGERFEWPDLAAPVYSEKVYCHGLLDQFGILCDGSVVPCCLDSEGAVTLGNIFRQNLDEILSSDRAKAIAEGFRCRHAAEELCRRCGYAQRF
jgi:radical SAM protein with 4Fe4S-binding SPASM domain